MRLTPSWLRIPARGSHRALGNRRGSSLVEMSFVLLVFFGLVVAVFEFGRLFFVQFTLHNAVREASRFGVTGNVMPDPDNPGQFLSRVESIVAKIQEVAPGLDVEATNVIVSGPAGPGDAGGPGDVVAIQVDYDIELLTPIIRPIFPDGVHHYSVGVVSRNELFQ